MSEQRQTQIWCIMKTTQGGMNQAREGEEIRDNRCEVGLGQRNGNSLKWNDSPRSQAKLIVCPCLAGGAVSQ